MKYYYEYEKKNFDEIVINICIIVVLLIIIGNTKSNINNSESSYILFSKEWFISIVGIFIAEVFLFYMRFLVISKRKNLKKWNLNLIKNGVMYKGIIEDIIPCDKDYFRLKISYYNDFLNRNIMFTLPFLVRFNNVDFSKKICCDVYESKDKKEVVDYDSQFFNISDENEIEINFGPLKLVKAVHQKYTNDWFGNATANNFKYEEE